MNRKICRGLASLLTVFVVIGNVPPYPGVFAAGEPGEASSGYEASAERAASDGRPAPAGSAISAGADTLLLADFEHGDDGWTAGDNAADAEWAIAGPDGGEMHSCLEVIGSESDIGQRRVVYRKFAEPLDLSEYRTIECELFAVPFPDDPYADLFALAVVFSADGTNTEVLIRVQPGIWNRVEAEIGGFAGRSAVTRIELALVVGTGLHTEYQNRFYLDNIRAGAKFDHKMIDRFLFDRFTLNGGLAETNAGRTRLTLNFDGLPAVLEAPVYVPRDADAAGCLCFRLANHSDLDSVTVSWSTTDSPAGSEDKSAVVRLEKQSDMNCFYIMTGAPDAMTGLKLSFGSAKGSVELISIGFVPAYIPEEAPAVCGTLTECELTDDLRYIRFAGDVRRETALENQDGVLAVYALDGVSLSDVLSGASEPLLVSPMTTKFDLLLPLADYPETTPYSLFCVAVLGADGNVMPVAVPRYLENPERAAAENAVLSFGEKGIAASDLSLIGEADADVTLIELDAERFFAPRSSGEPYSCLGELYYLNEAYLSELNDRITVLRNNRVSVLLRLVGWNEQLPRQLSASYEEERTLYQGDSDGVVEGERYLAALAAYAAGRWLPDGSISGMIVGEGMNFVADGAQTIRETAAACADELRLIYQCLAAENAGAKLYLSVSDLVYTSCFDAPGEIGLDQFIPALAAEISAHGDFAWDLCVENCYRTSAPDNLFVTSFEPSALTGILRRIGQLDTHLLFVDNLYMIPKTDSAVLNAQLVRGYYGALFNLRIDAYIAVLGNSACAGELAGTARLLDTGRRGEAADAALKTLGLSGWDRLIENFDGRRLPERLYTSSRALEGEPSGVRGRYVYASFDAFSGLNGMEKSWYCPFLAVSDGLSLTALLDGSSAPSDPARMGIIRRFDYPENLSLTPYLAVTMAVDQTVPACESVSGMLVLTAGNERFEAVFTLPTDKETTVYFDLGAFTGLCDVESFSLLLAEPLRKARLTLTGITGLSREYGDEALESAVAEERARRRVQTGVSDRAAGVWLWAGVVTAALTALTFVLLSRPRRDGDENGGEEDG